MGSIFVEELVEDTPGAGYRMEPETGLPGNRSRERVGWKGEKVEE